MEPLEEASQRLAKTLGITENKLSSFFPKAITPSVLPSEIGINSRLFYYWREKELLNNYPISKERRDWIKLNLLEVTWLKIIQQLLFFGISFKNIKAIGENLNNSLLESVTDEQLIKAAINNLKYDEVTKKDILAFMPTLLQNPERIIGELKKLNTVLGAMISDVLLLNSTINLILYIKEKEIKMTIEGLTLASDKIKEEVKEIKKSAHLLIPLNDLISEFINPKYEEHLVEFGLISKNEAEALTAIRDKSVREITIKKNDEDEITMTTSKHGNLSESDTRQLFRILGFNQYSEVRLVLRNKKNIFIERKTKYKL